MPFTGSHPAAILPFLRTPLPASALVIGSMAPDVPYYLPVQGIGWETHDALAVVTVDLVLGLAVWLLWHGLLAAPALAAAPAPVRARLVGRVPTGLRPRPVRRLLLVPVALVVGAATHVLWDEFTHAGGWGTARVGALRVVVAGQPGFEWAQYASGVAGAAVLAWWVHRWWVRTEPVPVRGPAPLWVWPALLAVAAVAGVAAALAAPDLQAAAFAGATRGGAVAAAVAVVLAVLWHARHRRA